MRWPARARMVFFKTCKRTEKGNAAEGDKPAVYPLVPEYCGAFAMVARTGPELSQARQLAEYFEANHAVTIILHALPVFKPAFFIVFYRGIRAAEHRIGKGF